MNKFSLPPNGAEVRAFTADDWAKVSLIYQDGIATGQATFETQVPTWACWDKNHLAAGRLVATSSELVIGWAALSPVSTRVVYEGVAETSVYVSGDWRGQGVGRTLLEALITESESNGIWTLQASIFPENTGSLRLHASCGFRVVGTRERVAKRDGVWRDTCLLERRSQRAGTN